MGKINGSSHKFAIYAGPCLFQDRTKVRENVGIGFPVLFVDANHLIDCREAHKFPNICLGYGREAREK